MNEKIFKRRGILITCFILLCFLVYAGAVVKIQLVDGQAYAMAGSAISSKTVSIEAARGEILDRNGNPLVINRQGNSIVFESALFPSSKKQEQRNEIIDSLIKLFEAGGVEWNDTLPIVLDENGAPVFAEGRETDVSALKSKDMLNLNDYATAENCMDALVKRYSLEDYTLLEARKIASVCYNMKKLGFSISYPYTFAEDVPTDIVAKIKENSGFYIGVGVEVVPYREYVDGVLAPHILGMTGAISAEEYAEKKEDGYGINDIIGKNGIEAAMEDYLRGEDGEKTISTDPDGKVTSAVTTDPVQGNTVVLTIDKNLQQITQDALEEVLCAQTDLPIDPAGAAIVIDVKTGDVLAVANYPTYDISTYSQNFAELNSDENAPLWNRALLSTYAPGSTAKISTAIAALEENLIDEAYTYHCSGTYHYLDMTFKCEQAHEKRNVNVVAAIDESCNSFFYEMGKLLGITKLNEYRTLLGLGQKTGCELPEATGILDSVEYRESLSQEWNPGYAVQSAIGQGGNLFSPIQLANYCATVANGGTRYQTSFVKSVVSYDYSQTVFEKEPVVACETGISEGVLDIVRKGMYEVAMTGYCRYAFEDLPVNAAAKTGTSQIIKKIDGVYQKINNGFLISYAPYESPEIALCIVGEGFSGGTGIAPIAAKIYDYYFTLMDTVEPGVTENTLIG